MIMHDGARRKSRSRVGPLDVHTPQTADKLIVKEERHEVKSTFVHVRDREYRQTWDRPRAPEFPTPDASLRLSFRDRRSIRTGGHQMLEGGSYINEMSK